MLAIHMAVDSIHPSYTTGLKAWAHWVCELNLSILLHNFLWHGLVVLRFGTCSVFIARDRNHGRVSAEGGECMEMGKCRMFLSLKCNQLPAIMKPRSTFPIFKPGLNAKESFILYVLNTLTTICKKVLTTIALYF